MRRRTGEDRRDERESAIHLRGDRAPTGCRGKSIVCEQVSHCVCTHGDL